MCLNSASLLVKKIILIFLLIQTVLGQEFCQGIPRDNSPGTECHSESFLEHCHNKFDVGTVLRYGCARRHRPRSHVRETGEGNHSPSTSTSEGWNTVICLPEKVWSSPDFLNFSCEREPYSYCGPGWANFFSWYNSIYVTVIIALCSVGCLANLVNLVVFTRPKMRNPLNMVLASLASTDFLFMFGGLLEHSRKMNRKLNGDRRTSYHEMVEELVNQLYYYLFHTWSIYLTLLVAFLRFYGVFKPLHSRRFATTGKVKWAIFLTLLLSGGLLPMMYWGARVQLRFDPDQLSNDESDPNPEYILYFSQLAQQYLYWVYAIMMKLIPCLVLSILIIGLIWCLLSAKSNRAKLQANESGRGGGGAANQDDDTSNSKGGKEFNRTTKMLIFMLIFFLLTEAPDAILSILVVTLPADSSLIDECLRQPSQFLRLLEFLSCLSSIFFYLTMSLAYRTTLKDLLVRSVSGAISAIGRTSSIVSRRTGSTRTS